MLSSSSIACLLVSFGGKELFSPANILQTAKIVDVVRQVVFLLVFKLIRF